MSTMNETLGFALARRTLMQRYPAQAEDDDLAAATLVVAAVPLSQDGSTTQVADVTRALIDQQMLAAQDVRDLWPDAPEMQIAAAEMTTKASAFQKSMDISAGDGDGDPRRHREAG